MRIRALLIWLLLLSGCSSVTFDMSAERIRFQWPVSGVIFQGFYGDQISGEAPGNYYDERGEQKTFLGIGRMHRAIDIDNVPGTKIVSAAPGVAHRYDWDGKAYYGNRVVVDHRNGYWTLYAHLQSITVQDGQQVNAGDLLGLMGSTGRSTGPHLHFEVRHSANGDVLRSPHYVPGNASESAIRGAAIPHNYPAVR